MVLGYIVLVLIVVFLNLDKVLGIFLMILFDVFIV